MNQKKRALIAILVGLLLSSIFFVLSQGAHLNLLFWPQAIGFYLTIILRGVHSATKVDFAAISIPTNATVYATTLYFVSGFFSSRKNQS